jgi:hypothetical protein
MADEELTSTTSIDDELRVEYRRIYGDSDKAEPEVQAELPLETETPTVDEEPKVDARERAPDGKFLAKSTQTEKPGQPAETKADTPSAAEAEAAVPAPDQPARDINRAPSSWKPSAKATWDKLPPEIRAEVHRRESDFLKGQSSLLPDAELGRSMREVISPYKMLIDSAGGTPEKMFGDLLRAEAVFRMGTPQQKSEFLQQVIRHYNVPLPSGGVAESQQIAAIPPQQQAINDPRVDGLLQHLQAQERQRQAQERQQVESAAATWIGETDAAGKPLRPYVDNVMDGLNVRIPQIRAANPSLSAKEVLQTAYDQEIWAHPEIRSILIREQQEQLEAKSRTENQERVNLARKASSVNVPRRGSTLAPAKPGTIDDTIRETARALGMITS